MSLHPVKPLRNRTSRSGRLSVAVASRACRTYFDWHPILGGFALAAVTTLGVTAASLTLQAVVPAVRGWAICTPLNGVMLAILLMSRRKLWPFLLLGYVLALSEGVSLAGATGQTGPLVIFGNVAELLVAAFTLPPYRNFKQWLQERRLLAAFGGYALVLGPAAMALTVAHIAAGGAGGVSDLHAGFWERMRIVVFAETLGMALGTSLTLVLCNRQTYRLFHLNALPRTIGLFSALAVSTWFANTQTAYPATFLPDTILVLIAFQIGIRGAVIGVAMVSSIVCALTVSASPGFLTATSPQSSIALAVLVTLPLGITLFKRLGLEQRVKDYQAELDKLKSLDRLTGIANRKRFDLVLSREWQRATRDPKAISLLMVDIDFFDLYNEHYGAHAGDDCLRSVASKMSDQPHRQYDLVSRFEGGRFSILLPGAPSDAVKRIGEEIRSQIAAFGWPHERSQFGRVTVSVGWASMTPGADLKPDLLIAAAEAALETARRKGKNRVEGFANNLVEMTAVR